MCKCCMLNMSCIGHSRLRKLWSQVSNNLGCISKSYHSDSGQNHRDMLYSQLNFLGISQCKNNGSHYNSKQAMKWDYYYQCIPQDRNTECLPDSGCTLHNNLCSRWANYQLCSCCNTYSMLAWYAPPASLVKLCRIRMKDELTFVDKLILSSIYYTYQQNSI